MFSAANDPFAGKAEIALTAQIHASESAARDAVRAFPPTDGTVVYAHYRGQEGIIFPTVISETTAPRVIQAVRLVLEREQKDAQLASATIFESFLVLGGARFPLPLRGPPAGRLILQAGRALSFEEMDVAAILVKEGHTVEALAEGTTRTADFLVDGVATELKTVSKLTGKALSASLSRRILEGARQASRVIIDARRQAGLTRELAKEAILRAYGADKLGRLTWVRIIGNGFGFALTKIE